MKKVTFNSISIQNFLSIGESPIVIDFKKGVTVITGENKDKGGKNGIGKSTISDAIFWCLFGNTIRELKKSEIQHNKNKKECKVVLNFTVKTEENETPYVLTRVLSPGSVELLVEAGQRYVDLTLSTIPETDKYIKDILGANEEVINNAVIMSINNTVPFMAQKKTDKRKFIEGILQLNIFGEMLLKARGEYNDIKKENDNLSTNFIAEQRILDSLNSSKSNFDQNKTERIDLVKEKVKNVLLDLDSLEKQNVKDVTSLKDDIKKHSEHIVLIKEKLKEQNEKTIIFGNIYTELYDELKQAKADIKKITDKGDTCPTCNRVYCGEDLEHVANEIKRLNDHIKEIEPLVEERKKSKEKSEWDAAEMTNKTERLREKINDANDEITKSALHDQKIRTLNEKIEEYKQSIRDIKNETFKDDDKINLSEEKIKELEMNLKNVKKQLAILDSAKFIVSEEGVKTYIVKKIIDVLNSRLNYYLQKLDAPAKCIFDEKFEETLYNEQGKECSYFNFSGGERKRIDTAILFTFQDVLRYHSGTSFSINIYDELFDCALDVKGTDKIMEILKEKVAKYDESIYIISHKASDEISNIDSVIYLEKSNGVTKLID